MGLSVGEILATEVATVSGNDGFKVRSHVDVSNAEWKDIELPIIAGDMMWNNGYLTSGLSRLTLQNR